MYLPSLIYSGNVIQSGQKNFFGLHCHPDAFPMIPPTAAAAVFAADVDGVERDEENKKSRETLH